MPMRWLEVIWRYVPHRSRWTAPAAYGRPPLSATRLSRPSTQAALTAVKAPGVWAFEDLISTSVVQVPSLLRVL